MKLQRTNNALRSVFFGLIQRVHQMVMPFVVRSIVIHKLGMEYAGLNNLFTSILQVLNLTELGVGSAMVYNMYKPIAEDNTEKICAIMRMYRLYYRIIGCAILIIGLLILPIVPKLISGDIPEDMNVYILYMLNLGTTVISYWLFSYKRSIIRAYQRYDVLYIISFIEKNIQYTLQIIALVLFEDFYLYLLISLIMQICDNILGAIVSKRMYPEYSPKGELDIREKKLINHQIKDLFTQKFGSIIVDSVDYVVISAYLGLSILGVYGNYMYVITAITTVMKMIYDSLRSGIGNSLVTDSNEKVYLDFRKLNFLIMWITGFCSCALCCLFQPFMILWVGEESLLSYASVVCFALYIYVYEIDQFLNVYKDAAGIWHSDRFRPLSTALLNLLLNLISVQLVGIYGIILSTVISISVLGIPWLTNNVFSLIFRRKPAEYLLQMMGYILFTIGVTFITYYICRLLPDGLHGFLLKVLVVCVLPNLLFCCRYFYTSEFIFIKSQILRVIRHRRRLAEMGR